MAVARDRLLRPVDVAEIYELHLRSIERIGVLVDEPERRAETPIRLGLTRGRGDFGTARLRNGRPRNLHGSSAALGRENIPPMVGLGSGRRGVRGRGSNSVLPSWYPRTPLRDITHVVRAIERRNARMRESEGREIDSPVPQDRIVYVPFIQPSGAQPEHEIFKTPKPAPHANVSLQSVGKVPKILLNITNQETGDLDPLTPQKKLLNSIEKVEKVVMEELNKLKRTPIAKKVEREKRIRTLMSMR